MSKSGDAFRKALERQAEQQAAIQKMLRNVVFQTIPRTLPKDALKLPKNRSMADTLCEDTKAQIEKAESEVGEGDRLVVFRVGPTGALSLPCECPSSVTPTKRTQPCRSRSVASDLTTNWRWTVSSLKRDQISGVTIIGEGWIAKTEAQDIEPVDEGIIVESPSERIFYPWNRVENVKLHRKI
jgi:hypothetical protein